MSDDPKVTKEAFARVLNEARADEIIDETAAMTKEEKDAALAKMGISREELKASMAKRRAKYEAQQAKSEPAKPEEPKPEPAKREGAKVIDLATYKRRVVGWAVSSGLVSALVAGSAVAINLQPTGSGPTFAAQDSAAEMPGDHERFQATEMCARKEFAYCLMWLDMAKKKDPNSEGMPSVIIERQLAESELARLKDGGAK
jgi:hypothetical protein